MKLLCSSGSNYEANRKGQWNQNGGQVGYYQNASQCIIGRLATTDETRSDLGWTLEGACRS